MSTAIPYRLTTTVVVWFEKPLDEQDDGCLTRVTDVQSKKVALALFRETDELDMDSAHIPLYHRTEQAAGRTFLTGGAEQLLNDKIYNLAES